MISRIMFSPRLRKINCLTALTLCAAATATQISAAPEAQQSTVNADKACIFASYGEINTAFCDNHIDRLDAQLAADYLQTDSQGHTMNRDGLIKKLQDERNSIRTITTNYTITSCTLQPKGVLVEMKMHSSGTGQKKVMFMKLRGTFTNDQIVQDLWVSTPTGWQIQARQVILDESHQQAA